MLSDSQICPCSLILGKAGQTQEGDQVLFLKSACFADNGCWLLVVLFGILRLCLQLVRRYHNCLVVLVTGGRWGWQATAAMPSVSYPGFKGAPEHYYHVSPQNTPRFYQTTEQSRRALITSPKHFCLCSNLYLLKIISVSLQQLYPHKGMSKQGLKIQGKEKEREMERGRGRDRD